MQVRAKDTFPLWMPYIKIFFNTSTKHPHPLAMHGICHGLSLPLVVIQSPAVKKKVGKPPRNDNWWLWRRIQRWFIEPLCGSGRINECKWFIMSRVFQPPPSTSFTSPNKSFHLESCWVGRKCFPATGFQQAINHLIQSSALTTSLPNFSNWKNGEYKLAANDSCITFFLKNYIGLILAKLEIS